MELTTQTFNQPFLVIGRMQESDLILDHWQVSRRHAYLQLIDGRFYCVDLGSRTGTHGGDATRRSGWLEPGRTIQIGPYAVRPEWPERRPRPTDPPPAVVWELPTKAVGPPTWRMNQYLALIGRSAACKIRVLDEDVSKFHCAVVLNSYGLWAIDLLGEHGVFVNDRKIRYARVEHGDELRVGSHVLTARYERPPLPLPAFPMPRAELMPVNPLRANPPGRLDLPARIPPMASGPDLATMIEKAGLSGTIDPSVNLLVHQFGMMQQNMLDQFHNTMMMMFDGFAALHREQSATIREEFEQVRKLSAEIEALRAETTRLAKEAAARPQAPPTPNGHQRPYPVSRPLPQLPGDPPRRPNAPVNEPEGDIHAQLCLKLASIESERQNRWQKILGMMSGS
jgi:pSer/pThr/pTyr-binding forkhead associated (FHA) protein